MLGASGVVVGGFSGDTLGDSRAGWLLLSGGANILVFSPKKEGSVGVVWGPHFVLFLMVVVLPAVPAGLCV